MSRFHLRPAALSPDQCARIIAHAAGAQMRDAGLVRQQTDHQIRRADIAWLDDIAGAGWVMDHMIALTAAANRDAFGYDLTDFGESAQVARYDAARQGHFDWHSDIGTGVWAAKRKLTIVVQLSDPDLYQGGTLQLQPDSADHDAPRDLGCATIFPSYMRHRVTPVTQGTRWSLTLWAHGPAFR